MPARCLLTPPSVRVPTHEFTIRLRPPCGAERRPHHHRPRHGRNHPGRQPTSPSLTGVEADDQPSLHSFAASIRRDQDAVTNGLTLPYSSGKVEGNASRIKVLIRQMYDRASFDLLQVRGQIRSPPEIFQDRLTVT